MMLSLSLKSRTLKRFFSLLIASSIIVATPQASQAQSWLPWLFQGIQVLQLSTLSDRQEVKIGQQINQELLNSGRVRLSRDAKLQQMLDQIGQRLAKASSRPNIPYTFQVVQDPAVNAFATMGGFVYINTGLIAKADNEAELASVVAHEIAHIEARHSVDQMRNAAISQGLMTAAGIDQSTMVQLGVQLAFNLPHSREAELEADQLGLKSLRRAGYAPIAMVNFMQKLTQQGGSVPAFLSTHPASSQRVVALNKAISPEIAYSGEGLDNEAYQRNVKSRL